MGDSWGEREVDPLFDDRIRAVHDLLVPRMSFVGFQLSALQTQVDGVAADAVASCVALIDELVGDVRRLLADGETHDGRTHDGVTRDAREGGTRGSTVC